MKLKIWEWNSEGANGNAKWSSGGGWGRSQEEKLI